MAAAEWEYAAASAEAERNGWMEEIVELQNEGARARKEAAGLREELAGRREALARVEEEAELSEATSTP